MLSTHAQIYKKYLGQRLFISPRIFSKLVNYLLAFPRREEKTRSYTRRVQWYKTHVDMCKYTDTFIQSKTKYALQKLHAFKNIFGKLHVSELC